MSLIDIKENLKNFSSHLSDREKLAFSILIDSSISKAYELRSLESSQILNSAEKLCFEQLSQTEENIGEINHDLVMIMKATRLCNLRCVYCHSWRKGPNQVMPFATVAKAIRDSLSPGGRRHVEFVWHGGETTLLSIEYFKKVIWLQEFFRNPNVHVNNAIQTNGTLLSDEWISFLKDYQFDVGISLDGPPEINNKRRLDKAQRGTSHLVEKGIKKLKEHNIPFGILIVIDQELISLGIRRLLDYFLEIGASKIGILNAIPENNAQNEPIKGSYLPWHEFIDFQKELFRIWYADYRGRLFIRELEDLFTILKKGTKSKLCYFQGDCMGHFLTIDPNGDINACDKYIDDKDYFFGNLLKEKTLVQLLNHSQTLKKSITIQSTAIENMKSCPWFHVCHGSCPHDRRLNERYVQGFDGTCCGLSPLLEVMQSTLNNNMPVLNST